MRIGNKSSRFLAPYIPNNRCKMNASAMFATTTAHTHHGCFSVSNDGAALPLLLASVRSILAPHSGHVPLAFPVRSYPQLEQSPLLARAQRSWPGNHLRILTQ
jgi:hypothetical protein